MPVFHSNMAQYLLKHIISWLAHLRIAFVVYHFKIEMKMHNILSHPVHGNCMKLFLSVYTLEAI